LRRQENEIFKPSDFAGSGHEPFAQYAADEANAKLEREGKVVYSEKDENDVHWPFHQVDFQGSTHKALLINIEPIEKCMHTVASSKVGFGPWKYCHTDGALFCGKCGVNLKVKEFEVAE